MMERRDYIDFVLFQKEQVTPWINETEKFIAHLDAEIQRKIK